jgi:Homeodomain-like domain
MDVILLAWCHGRLKCQEGVMKKLYRVTLTESERGDLQKLVSVGKAAARKLSRARMLLLADQAEGGPCKLDSEIVEALGCGRASVERVRKQFVEEGLEAVLSPKPSQRVYERKMDGMAEAHLIALACSAAPEGRSQWTLRLLGDQMVALGHVDSLSYETVRRVLKKTNSSRG